MKWWIQRANRYGQTSHDLEQTLEISLLHRQQFGQRTPPSGFIIRKNHLAHGLNAIALKKHMLGAAQTYSLAAEGLGDGGLVRLIRVGAHAERAHLIRPFHEFGELLIDTRLLGFQRAGEQYLKDFGRKRLDLTLVNLTCTAVD